MNMIEQLILVFITILPTILLWLYITKLDKQKEPQKVLVKLFTAGVLSAIITLVISLIICLFVPGFIDYNVALNVKGFLYVFFGIGLIEEFSKLLMLYCFGWKDENLDETYDTVLYCMIVALGFATFENILYSVDGTLSTAILRLFTAVPGHVIDGAFMGYFIYRAKVAAKKKFYFFLALIVPTLTHTIYDFIVLTAVDVIGILIFIGFVILEFVVAIVLVKRIAKKSKPFAQKITYCAHCGAIVNTKYCTNCGNRNENQKNVDF